MNRKEIEQKVCKMINYSHRCICIGVGFCALVKAIVDFMEEIINEG